MIMSRAEVYYLIPYFISLAVSASVAIYVWRRKQAPGATAFLAYAIGQAVWILGFILELISIDINTKIFWDSLQWLAGLFLVIMLPIFAAQYTEYKFSRPQLLLYLSLIFPSIFAALLLTDNLFHWIYINPYLSSDNPFQELLYDLTPPVYGYAIYSYIVILGGLFLLARRIIRPHGLYRTQVILITLGLFIPILGTALPLFNTYLTPQRDAIPFTTVFGNILIVLGLFRFRVFEVAPVARDKVFEAMVEPVVILDNKNNIVDINGAMLVLLGMDAKEVIGEPAKKNF